MVLSEDSEGLATAKQISAVITSATSTRSNRPRRSQLGRGAGGFVVSVTNVVANLLTAFTSMPPSVGAGTGNLVPRAAYLPAPYPSRGGPGCRRPAAARAAVRGTGPIPAGQAGNRLARPTLASHRRP